MPFRVFLALGIFVDFLASDSIGGFFYAILTAHLTAKYSAIKAMFAVSALMTN